MLSFNKSLALLLVASGVLVVLGDDCSDAVKSKDFDSQLFTKNEVLNITSATHPPGCTKDQYAYVIEVNIASIDSSQFGFTTFPKISSNNANCTQASATCRNDGDLTCGKGADKDSFLSVTCLSDTCNIRYYATWACANLGSSITTTTATTAPTTAPSTTTSNSTTNSTTTVQNSAWAETGAGLAGMAAAAIAALLQL